MAKGQKTLNGEILDNNDFKEGYVKDFIKGYFIKETPEEIRRQEIEKRLVHEWEYPKSLIEIEVNIRFGSIKDKNKSGRADIVIFNNEKSKNIEENAYIIVEVKNNTKKNGLDQLKTYLNASTAEYGIWYNGRDIVFIKRLRKPHKFQEISRIPKYGEKFDDLEKPIKKEKQKPAYNLKVRFDDLHNYLYANEGFLKEKLFGEIIKLIFMKIVDEKLPEIEALFWISEKEYEEILKYGDSSEFKLRIDKLWKESINLYPEIEDKLKLKPLSIAELVRRLQEFSFIRTDDDVKGTAFQTFIHENMRGDRGEFFTPQPAIEMVVKMLNPNYHESVIDPACGTGRFLITNMENLKSKHKFDRKGIAEYARAHIAGIDINSDLIKVAKMYMVLYDDGWSNLYTCNSLLPIEDIEKIAKEYAVPKIARAALNKFDIVLTNPPFGTRGKIKDQKILNQYDLAHKWKYDKQKNLWKKTNEILKQQIPEILFIERCWQLLNSHGRMGIVLPDGILTNSSLGYVREWIIEHSRLLAVVSLPEVTFIPYGAGTKASILFIQKVPKYELEDIKQNDYPVFMAVVNKIGYDVRGKSKFKRNNEGKIMKNSNGENIIDSDVPNIIDSFEKFKKENDFKF